jgi:hypothetical protein
MEEYILKKLWKDLIMHDLELEFDEFKEVYRFYDTIEDETKMVAVASDDELDEVYYEEVPVE